MKTPKITSDQKIKWMRPMNHSLIKYSMMMNMATAQNLNTKARVFSTVIIQSIQTNKVAENQILR